MPLGLQEALFLSLPIWQNDKKTLVGQGRQQECHQNGYSAGADCVGGSVGIQHPRPNHPAQRQAHTQRYKYATVFVDQFSGYTFVYLQKHLTSKETVTAKHAFESSADQRGVKILHYHADNGRFADNAFIPNCKAQQQGLSYCGVNAHFQNGIAERRIWDLQEQTRTSMLYAMNKWKWMILICLWPYAIRHANDVANVTPRKGEDLSPLEWFTGVNVMPKLRHFHAFGCPTYVLDNELQSDQGTPKWKQ